MEFDGSKINKLYRQDTGLVFVFILFVWVVLGFVLMSVARLAVSDLIRNVALVAGVVAGIFVTSSLVAVLVHLKKNRIALYSEELQNTVPSSLK
ncbi:MAG: hypothetical protein VR66_27770 [Peptococcaceae bacterium BRH_c23]|nr:MAG: hypothetical protein VR66_27770 [Peptococcaceae bacterium BRH_c23]KJS80347.1 MAG: hypothetical protein JL57_28245 [Desulfosporosinus sp. BICA1-9]HBW37637.1 hypothetical protein [Desulfosporosinus sp.]